MGSRKNYSSYDDFYRNLHTGGASVIDFNNKRAPCIYVENWQFRTFVDHATGQKMAVDTNLDIYHNERDVFVQVNLKILDTAVEYSFLFHASEMLSFFEAMFESTLIVLSPTGVSSTPENIFVIQLPKKGKLEEAFRIISKYTGRNY
jgi:hypothetical protein